MCVYRQFSRFSVFQPMKLSLTHFPVGQTSSDHSTSVCRRPVRWLHSILKSVLQWMKAPLPLCLFKLLSSWNKCGRIWRPAGCARHGRRVSWRAQRPNSPSLSGKCSEGSVLDRAAETQMTIYPTLPCCFFLQRRKNMKPGVNFSSAATKLLHVPPLKYFYIHD